MDDQTAIVVVGSVAALFLAIGLFLGAAVAALALFRSVLNER
jgi:hypothetical protein